MIRIQYAKEKERNDNIFPSDRVSQISPPEMSLSKMKSLFVIPSSRVKCLDFHPTKPIILAALYTGEAIIVDALRGSIIRTYSVHQGIPLRACRWIPKTGDFVTGGDNRSLNFYSQVKGKQTLEIPDAHDHYIRSLAVHPNEMLLLSSSDDLSIKLWDISKGCTAIRTFQVHTGIVMDVKWNPRDLTTFASCSLDGNVIFWDMGSEQPRFTQRVSNKCVNSISFAVNGDRSLIATGSDDTIVTIIDLQSRSVVTTLEGHDNNVTRVEFHPTRPLIITTAEDNSTIIWSSITFRKENRLSSALERGWALGFSNCPPLMAIGHDKGLTIHKFKNLGTPMSLVPTGKLIIAQGAEVSVAVLKNMPDFVDGSEITLPLKEGITSDQTPVHLHHSPNGRYITVCGENEWTIYTTLGFRSRAYGNGISFIWCSNSTSFAALNTNRLITVYKSFDDSQVLNVFALKIWGGELIGALVNNGLEFYDWEDLQLVRRIEVHPSEVLWYGNYVAIRTKTNIVVLSYNSEYQSEFVQGSGYEDSFDVVYDVDGKASSICWANGILLFTDGQKVNRISAGIVLPTASLKNTVDLIGYLPREGVVLVADQMRTLLGVHLPPTLLDFESAVAADEEADPELVDEDYRARTAKFLKQLGKNELALLVSNDTAMRFDLAIELGELETASQCASDQTMWRRLARAAIGKGEMKLAEKALFECGDLSTLLVLYKSQNRKSDIENLVTKAKEIGQLNVAFTAALAVGMFEECVDILIASEKYAQAAIFARTRCPKMMSKAVQEWKKHTPNERISGAIADPADFPSLFDEIEPEESVQA